MENSHPSLFRRIFPFFGFLLLFLSPLIFFPPQISFGNQADGFAYYLPLRSLYFDGNLDFGNENVFFENSFGRIPYDWRHRTLTAFWVFPYSVGPAVLWSPFFLFSESSRVSLAEPVYKNLTVKSLPGFSPENLQALITGTRFFGILSLILTALFIDKLFPVNRPVWSEAAVFLTAAGTPFYYYFYYQPLMSHVLSAFTASLFLFLWVLVFGRRSLKRFFLLGLSLGFISLVRWQDIFYAVFPLAEILFAGKREETLRRKTILGLGIFFGGMLSFLPQVIFWKVIYGNYFVIPQGVNFLNLSRPELYNFLFSFRHGLFSWTPILLISFLGLVFPACQFLIKRESRQGKMMGVFLLGGWLMVLSSIYLNSSLADWHGSDSFGARRAVSLFPLFAAGIFYLITRLEKRLRFLLITVMFGLVFYNVFFSYLYADWRFDHFIPVYPRQVIREAGFFLLNLEKAGRKNRMVDIFY